MATRRTRDLEAALTTKGFHQDNNHHEMYRLYVGGRKTSVRTYISHGKSEYGDNLLGQIARQVKLRRAELDDLVDCPLDGEAYAALLIQRGHVKLPS